MRVAVTGASGFVGGYIARVLAESGHDVVALGRRRDSELRGSFASYVQWDICGGRPIAMPEVDAVVHCAARVGQWGPEREYRSVNVDGTRRVLETFHRAARFVHMSSASVYAIRQSQTRLREEARIGEPLLTAYARSKVDAERVVAASGRAHVILRPHAVYGPGDTTLLPRVLAARRYGWFPLPGDGQKRISVTYVGNLAHAVQCALDAEIASGAFNVADDEEPTVDDLLRTILRRHGVGDRLLHVPYVVARVAAVASEGAWRLGRWSGEPRLTRYAVTNLADPVTLDLSRTRAELGYAPRWNFRDAPLTTPHVSVM